MAVRSRFKTPNVKEISYLEEIVCSFLRCDLVRELIVSLGAYALGTPENAS